MKIAYLVRYDGESVVFAPLARAELVQTMLAAKFDSKTWGEFKSALPDEVIQEVLALDFEEGEPTPDTPFDGLNLCWNPPWLQQEMLEWFPRDLAEKYGSLEDSVHDGEFLLIDFRGLSCDEILDSHALCMELFRWVYITNVPDRLTDNRLVINIAGGGYFPGKYDVVIFAEDFTGDVALFVLRDTGIKNTICYVVANLVRMTFRH